MPAVTAAGTPYAVGGDQLRDVWPETSRLVAQRIDEVEAARVGGVWRGTLNFVAGWADLPAIPAPALSGGLVWSPTALVQDTHNGRFWVVSATQTGPAAVYLRVYNALAPSFAGGQAMSVHWRAVPVDGSLMLAEDVVSS